MVEYNNFRIENEKSFYYMATIGAFCELTADGTGGLAISWYNDFFVQIAENGQYKIFRGT